jgi:hypothetical protein
MNADEHRIMNEIIKELKDGGKLYPPFFYD